MRLLDWLSVTGFVLTAAGVIVAVIQTYRAHQAAAKLEQEKRIRNATIWHNIALTLNAYDTLEDARGYLSAAPSSAESARDVLGAKLSSARRCVVDQYLDLLRSAVLDEPDFNEETVQFWISQGRLENEWRIKQARKFIRQQPRVAKDQRAQMSVLATKNPAVKELSGD